MAYNPFERGSYPAGVRSEKWTDEKNGYTLEMEIWYPATAKYKGMDLNPATKDRFDPIFVLEGDDPDEMDKPMQDAVRDAEMAEGKFPLVILSHGWAGFRRESSFLGTHLASHGYIVISTDHRYSTVWEFEDALQKMGKGTRADFERFFHEGGEARRQEIPFMVEKAMQKLPIEDCGAGISGASFGGWTSLLGPEVDPRIIASVPMVPSIYSDITYDSAYSQVGDPINYDSYGEDVKILILASDRDSLIPLPLQLENFKKIRKNERIMTIMLGADHMHNLDDIELCQPYLKEETMGLIDLFPDMKDVLTLSALRCPDMEILTPGEIAKTAWRGMVLAHMDKVLKKNADAEAFMAGDIDAATETIGANTVTIR